jgi:hypothetical protein
MDLHRVLIVPEREVAVDTASDDEVSGGGLAGGDLCGGGGGGGVSKWGLGVRVVKRSIGDIGSAMKVAARIDPA